MKKLLAFLLIAASLFADMSGPRPGTGAGASWTNPTNTLASDNAYATCSMAAGYPCGSTHTVTTLGFAIPSGATIVGIEVLYEHKCSGVLGCSTASTDFGSVNISGCTGTSNNNADAMAWTTSDVTTTLGSASDLWGLTCTAAQVNAAGFGVTTTVVNLSSVAAMTASLDYIAVTVYYTTGAGSRRRIVISQTRAGRNQA